MKPERRRDPPLERPDAVPAPAGRIESLGLLQRACWIELERATVEREHGWRALALATIDGTRADARLIILREVDASARRLRFYTDARSRKVAQLRTQPEGSLLAWCPRLSWQLRMRVRLSLDTDEHTVRSRWARLRMTPSSQDYVSPLAPGAPLSEEHEPGQGVEAHFAVVLADIVAMDWLELHADGHRRAVFDEHGERWVQP